MYTVNTSLNRLTTQLQMKKEDPYVQYFYEIGVLYTRSSTIVLDFTNPYIYTFSTTGLQDTYLVMKSWDGRAI